MDNKLKGILKVTLILVAIIAMASTGRAASYYVDAVSGKDGNPGTKSAPWQYLAKVNGAPLKGGDFVYFKRGGVWNDVLYPISGSNGNPVTYAAYGAGNKPRMQGFSAKGKSYITAKELEFRNGADYSVLYIADRSHHITVESCDLFADATNTAFAAARIENNSMYNKILNSKIAHLNLLSQHDGLGLQYNANYNLIQGNKIGPATHDALGLIGANSANPSYSCSYNVIKNNIINNPEGRTMGAVSNSNRNLIEGNIITGGKSTRHNMNSSASISFASSNTILRYNVIANNPSKPERTRKTVKGIRMSPWQHQSDPPNQIVGNAVYNNVLYNIANLAVHIGNENCSSCYVKNNIYKNNMIYDNGGYQITIDNKPANIEKPFFINNIIYSSDTHQVISDMGRYYSVAQAQANDPTHWAGNLQKAPKVDIRFRPLAKSPSIDAGAFLTTVTSKSGSGTVFQVQEARYFTDGFGVIPGDKIKVGSADATISRINYSSNAITVTKPITWTKGVEVSLPYSGSRPDIGAYER